MHTYEAYGLGIESEFALPELTPAGTPPSVRIRAGALTRLPPECLMPGVEGRVRADSEQIQFDYDGIGRFLLRRGVDVVVDAEPSAADGDLRSLLVGPVLATVLHQRRVLLLHASTVDVAGNGVAIAGGSGAGKSTTAAVLEAAGHRLVTDDVTAVEWRVDGAVVQPALPGVKLWPDALDALGEDPGLFPRVHASLEKRTRAVSGAFVRRPVPLRRIYILADGPTISVETLTPSRALPELLRHSYDAQLIAMTASAPRHFVQCAEVATGVIVRRLQRPRLLAALPYLARAIVADVRAPADTEARRS